MRGTGSRTCCNSRLTASETSLAGGTANGSVRWTDCESSESGVYGEGLSHAAGDGIDSAAKHVVIQEDPHLPKTCLLDRFKDDAAVHSLAAFPDVPFRVLEKFAMGRIPVAV